MLKRPKAPPKPTPAQVRMMRSVRDYGDPYRHLAGMSAHGGGTTTCGSLVRRGWITGGAERLTDAGAAVLADAEREVSRG